MGRGRAKAKQTKVARRLKYYSPDTDLSALEKELRSETNGHHGGVPDSVDEDADDEWDASPAGEDDHDAWTSNPR